LHRGFGRRVSFERIGLVDIVKRVGIERIILVDIARGN
jgi:hypothetical protein